MADVADISEVAEGIYQIQVNGKNQSSSFGRPRSSAVYFIDGEQTALIEAGPTAVAPAVLDAISQLGHDPFQLSYIILTHIHLDHAGGAGTLAQRLPQLKVLVHQRGARHLISPWRLIEGTRQAYGEGFEEEYGPILPISERQVRAVEDGEVIPLGDRELRIVYTPGHAPHHICIYEAKSQGIFSGDALSSPLRAGSGMVRPGDVVRPVEAFDLDAALETIDKLLKLEPKIIFYSHGGVSREAVRLIQWFRATTEAYRDIILEAMRNGEPREQMVQRLQTYQKEQAPSEYQQEERRLDSIITSYVAHFKSKGIA